MNYETISNNSDITLAEIIKAKKDAWWVGYPGITREPLGNITVWSRIDGELAVRHDIDGYVAKPGQHAVKRIS